MLSIELRPESPADFRAVEELTRNAFWNHHAPGCDEHYLAHILRESSNFVPELDYVAVQDGKVVGSIMYTRFGFVPAEQYGVGTSWGVYIISLQACELQPGALEDCEGYFEESRDFQIDPEKSAAFDKGFSYRKKVEGLPSQERFQWIIQQTKPRCPRS